MTKTLNKKVWVVSFFGNPNKVAKTLLGKKVTLQRGADWQVLDKFGDVEIGYDYEEGIRGYFGQYKDALKYARLALAVCKIIILEPHEKYGSLFGIGVGYSPIDLIKVPKELKQAKGWPGNSNFELKEA